MWRFALLVGATLSTGVGSPARPQTLVAKRIQLEQLATCLVRQAPQQATRMLSTPLNSKAEHLETDILVRGHASCIRGSVVSGQVGAFRGAIAQMMFVREPALLETLAQRNASAPVRAQAAEGRGFVIGYARCLIDTDPGRAAAMLRTGSETAAERSAFLAFDEALKQCMPETVSYKVNLVDLRNQLAALAWQLAALKAVPRE